MENFKVIIKPIKPRVKELDPIKIEALKEKRRLQREARKNRPKEESPEPKEPKVKPDYTAEIENINKTVKNLVGFSIDEINQKLKASIINNVQVGLPVDTEPIQNKKSMNTGKLSEWYIRQILKDKKIIFQEQPRIKYQIENKSRYIQPDFFIPDKNLFIEVKSRSGGKVYGRIEGSAGNSSTLRPHHVR
jgi:ribosomal protein L13E